MHLLTKRRSGMVAVSRVLRSDENSGELCGRSAGFSTEVSCSDEIIYGQARAAAFFSAGSCSVPPLRAGRVSRGRGRATDFFFVLQPWSCL